MSPPIDTARIDIALSRSRWVDYVELAKPRLNALAVASALSATYLASAGKPDLALMLHVLLATSLIGAGTAALNQLIERHLDCRMPRTWNRPLPSARVSPSGARLFGVACSSLGVAYFAIAINGISAMLALLTWVLYLFVYTPLKRRTQASTIVGAVPGALPVVIGWTAATGRLELPAMILFAIVFVWQMPHFWAIGTLYRDDYARADFPILPVVDTTGRATARWILIFTVALIAVSFLPYWAGVGGVVFVVGAAVLGAMFLALTIRHALCSSRERARDVFLASIIYLPLLLTMLMLDRIQPL